MTSPDPLTSAQVPEGIELSSGLKKNGSRLAPERPGKDVQLDVCRSRDVDRELKVDVCR